MISDRRRAAPVLIKAVVIASSLCLSATVNLSAAEDARSVRTDLAAAPWYDAKGDTWKRVVPQDPAFQEDAEEGATSPFAFAMYAMVVAALCLLAALAFRLRGTRGGAGAGRPMAGIATLGALPFAVPESTLAPESAYRQALAAGDWRGALIWLYAWLLTRLDHEGVVRIMPGKTNRSFLHEAAPRPEICDVLAETITIFERTYFGHQPVMEATIHHLEQAHRGLLATLATESGP